MAVRPQSLKNTVQLIKLPKMRIYHQCLVLQVVEEQVCRKIIPKDTCQICHMDFHKTRKAFSIQNKGNKPLQLQCLNSSP
jgi:hypothetical protein